MIFIRIIRNYFFKLEHLVCARTVKILLNLSNLFLNPVRSIGNILLADKFVMENSLFLEVFLNLAIKLYGIIRYQVLRIMRNYMGSPGWMTWLGEIKRLWKLSRSGFLAGSKNMDQVQVRAGRPDW